MIRNKINAAFSVTSDVNPYRETIWMVQTTCNLRPCLWSIAQGCTKCLRRGKVGSERPVPCSVARKPYFVLEMKSLTELSHLLSPIIKSVMICPRVTRLDE